MVSCTFRIKFDSMYCSSTEWCTLLYNNYDIEYVKELTASTGHLYDL